ncbi:hypothetical protein EW145_g6374 [Phellinidium pouzarii]|uniref:Peroxisomal ATPase PEX1 n=1 Tax=Phellinidium pouzarii TaxID=167371 RepID=A0A4V3XBU6_9AGAM|nr:hypothetical protein EW145_g6374 [Phellinidium pouzarii]
MPRRARIEFVSLHSSLVNLPISIYGPLVERRVRPQNLAVHLLLVSNGVQKINTSEKNHFYAGWTGMASSSSLARFREGSTSSDALETIEIDPQFANGLGLHLGDILCSLVGSQYSSVKVEIGLLHDLPIATSVVTEPYSADDWEIIELHAAYVEQNLLSQVRVASIGQEVDVWVFGRTRARLRVVSFEPNSTRSEAVMLSTNTEVSISPKKRSSYGKSSSSVANQESQAAGEDAKGQKFSKYAKRRAIPPIFFSFSESATPSDQTAWVSPGTFCALASKLPPLSDSDYFGPITVRHLKAPPDPLASDPVSAAPAAPLTSKIIHSADGGLATQASGEAETPREETIILRWSREVPDKQVLFQEYNGVKDWEYCFLISYTASKLSSVANLEDHVQPRRIQSHYKHELAGVDEYINKCTNALWNMSLMHDLMSKAIPSVLGILILGRPGSGKTSIVKAVARLMEDSQILAYIIYVDFAKHADDRVSRLKAYFNYLYDKAAWHRPSILVFDSLDKVLSAEVEVEIFSQYTYCWLTYMTFKHADSFRSRQLTELFLNVFTHRTSDTKGITMIATAESETALHPRVHQSHLFKETLKLKPPGKDARRDIITQNVKSRMKNAPDLYESTEFPLNFTALATQTEGYLPTDLKDFVSRAVHAAAIRSLDKGPNAKVDLLPVDFEKAQVDFIPLSLRDIKLQKSDVSWNDIGGLHETRKTLRETLEWPTKYAAIFAKSPLRLRSGILLYGYPGCGKTLLASAVAKECGLNFISVKGPELLNKYIGASEKSVRSGLVREGECREALRAFFLMNLIPLLRKGHDSTGVTDRVVNQMLTQMDGAEGLEGVYVLAATRAGNSRPDLIDGALLRPGRLDKSLLCDMPNFEDRKEILQAVSEKVAVSSTVDWDVLAASTDGFSGADLQAVIYNAHLDVVHNALAEKEKSSNFNAKGKGKEGTVTDAVDETEDVARTEYFAFGGGKGEVLHRSRAEETALQKKLQVILASRSSLRFGSGDKRTATPSSEKQTYEITDEHLRRSLASMRPSVSQEEQARLQRIYRSFVSDRSGDMPVPPDTGSTGSRATLM